MWEFVYSCENLSKKIPRGKNRPKSGEKWHENARHRANLVSHMIPKYKKTSGKNEIPISHLLYADDVLVFTNGANRSLNSLMALLRNYERSLGQLINIDKSSFYVGNRAQSRITHINRITGMTHKEFPLRSKLFPAPCRRRRRI